MTDSVVGCGGLAAALDSLSCKRHHKHKHKKGHDRDDDDEDEDGDHHHDKHDGHDFDKGRGNHFLGKKGKDGAPSWIK
jgi:ABC-type Zn2+ transport system substrate-binding protein/surface adhesin